MPEQRFLVIGLGRFGRSLAQALSRRGIEVMAIDRNEALVQEVSTEVDATICADATDEAALVELKAKSFSCAIVAIGADSTEASILATALLEKLGAPRIIARAIGDLHGRVLAAVGAHEVVNPEAEMGAALGRRLATPNVLEHLVLGPESALAEIALPTELVGKTVGSLALRRRYGVSLVAVRRGERVFAAIGEREHLQEGDMLVVIGAPGGIEDLASGS